MMKIEYALTVSAVALGVFASGVPANASPVTDLITFSDTGSYCLTVCTHGYQNTTISGSFDITFDPTVQILPSQSTTGVITNLTITVSDPYFPSSPLSFNGIGYYAFDGTGTLTLSSLSSLSKTFSDSPDITIGINGWGYVPTPDPVPMSSVWYSQTGFYNTLTSSGYAAMTPEITSGPNGDVPAMPLSSTWTMMLIGLTGLGFIAYRQRKQNTATAAT